ncbi:FIG001614: Membrane protein [Cronobacter sakazakii 701]|nr:FIG001614: Membrane protein [Cronobacter sakazakii 701]
MSTLLTINRVYYLIGFIVMLLVVTTWGGVGNPKRFTTALFWFLFGGIFLFGDLLVQGLGRSLAYRK